MGLSIRRIIWDSLAFLDGVNYNRQTKEFSLYGDRVLGYQEVYIYLCRVN